MQMGVTEKRYDGILCLFSASSAAKEKILFNWLVKYKKDHLLFLHDFSVPFEKVQKIQKVPTFPVSLAWPMKDYLLFRSNILEL